MSISLNARIQALIVDENEISAIATGYLLIDPSKTVDQMDTLLGIWLTALDFVTGGKIIDATVELKPTLPSGLKGAAETGLSIIQTGTFNFTCAGSLHVYGFSVPGISNHTDVISGGKPVLGTGTPCQALVDNLLFVDPTFINTNDTAQQLEALRDAYISFRKRTEPVARGSFRLA